MTRGKLVLAFSGGLDTQVALHWLREDQGWDIVAYVVDVGQPDVEAASAMAEMLGVPVQVVDCKDEFARDYVFAATRANAVYHGQYLMGPSLGRPLIAARQVEFARHLDAQAVGHGATGHGNDQVRFELAYAALAPELEVVAPWRFWPFTGRSDLLKYARQHDLPVGAQGNRRPFSIDESLVHTSYAGEALEDPAQPPPEGLMHRVADSRVAARLEPQDVTVEFEKGNPVGVDGRSAAPAALIEELNRIGARHGIGRLDLVEDRVFGLKTRNLYEQPAATMLWHAHRAVESITMDGEVIQLREEFVPRYARLVYCGLWHSPERRVLQAAVDESNETVTGSATLRVHAGGIQVVARRAPSSLYQQDLASFDEDTELLPMSAASGWMSVESLRLRARA
ncbi:MAG: argininosuccinate synthase [Micrococcales bacterium]|nr:MAG: argininosuccinate synthase [Micrococcales bacterium]PIE26098.1 MAG: argininosuccinate synthase [Micrococcales bacterium]